MQNNSNIHKQENGIHSEGRPNIQKMVLPKQAYSAKAQDCDLQNNNGLENHQNAFQIEFDELKNCKSVIPQIEQIIKFIILKNL